MRIGVVVASKKERKAFLDIFGRPNSIDIRKKTFEVFIWHYINKHIYLILSGIGEIAAATSVQYLIDRYNVDRIINYGVVGGLSEEHEARKLGIVQCAIHYDFDITFDTDLKVGEYPDEGLYLTPNKAAVPEGAITGLTRFICASADKIVGGGEPKRRLKRDFGADICEMEAAGIIRTCNRNCIPCTLVKAISDSVDEDVEEFDQNVYAASRACVRLVKKLIRVVDH